MANRDLVAVGTSAGGVEALSALAKGLPEAFPAALLVTIHLSDQFPSSLDEVVSRAGPLRASFATDGETIRNAHIYIAPAGRHLIVDGNHLSLGNGPRENNARPAIDPMMRSVALCCADRAIGIVLTGTLDDGASGLWTIGRCGGISVVQDPRDAAFPEMPRAALNSLQPDHVVALADLPRLLATLVREPAGPRMPLPAGLKYEVGVARGLEANMQHMDRVGRRSVLTCPDCDGVLWEIDEGDLMRYRCHVGHAYTYALMNIVLDESVRRALGSSLRALEERVALMRKLARQSRAQSSPRTADNWEQKAQEFEREANTIREAIKRVEDVAERAREATYDAA